jgi:DNA-binding transcriptional ArsR family regulator
MAYGYAMAALGDPTRREIFERLRSGPRAVGELARDLPVSRPAVSQHLRVLKEAGLVRERRVGTRHLYRIDPEGLGELRAYLDDVWTQALADFKAVVESKEEKAKEPAGRRASRARATRSPGKGRKR